MCPDRLHGRLAAGKNGGSDMKLFTTAGEMDLSQVNQMLPHEHVFTDLRQSNTPGFGEADPEDVIALTGPALADLKARGINVMVEATPVGVGRRTDILKAVSQSQDFPLVVPTGIYREPWVPRWAINAPAEALTEWMISELSNEIEQTGIKADWIKISAGDNGITAVEEKILRAAIRAAKTCGAVIGSHTIRGEVVSQQVDIIEEEGYDPRRFIWIHTQAEPDTKLHLSLAARGVWLEFDGIGGGASDEQYLGWLDSVFDAGFGKQVMISQDRGWFDPAHPGGEHFKPYTYLSDVFLPKLKARGLGASISQLMRDNPFNAFAR